MEETINYIAIMKKLIYAAIVAIVCLLSSNAYARQPKICREAVFVTTMHCAKCEKKIVENVSFEKGVMDLTSNLDDKTVTIVYDTARTDTLKLANSIRELGYEVKVVSDNEKKKK